MQHLGLHIILGAYCIELLQDYPGRPAVTAVYNTGVHGASHLECIGISTFKRLLRR